MSPFSNWDKDVFCVAPLRCMLPSNLLEILKLTTWDHRFDDSGSHHVIPWQVILDSERMTKIRLVKRPSSLTPPKKNRLQGVGIHHE